MCHNPDSLPAIPQDRDIHVQVERLTLDAADGTTFAAISAGPP